MQSNMKDKYDVVIIGGGPAGLSAAVNVVARGRKPLVLKSGDSNLEKAELVNNHLGFINITGKEMQKQFEAHALHIGVDIVESKAANVIPFDGRFMVNIQGSIVTTDAVVLAIGGGKPKEIKGEKELLGRGVSYCATCDGMLFRNKKAIVFGDSDDLLEEADFLRAAGVEVTILSKKSYDPKETHGIPVINEEIRELIPGSGGLLAEIETLSGKKMKVEGAFLLRKSISPDSLIQGVIMEKGRIVVDEEMKTSVEGVFACGDCTGAPLQISTAVSEGLIAGQNAAKYVDKINSQ